MLDRLLPALADPAVRDLAWSLGSPALLDPHASAFSGRVLSDAFCQARLQEAADWLQELDRQPAALHAFIEADHSHRLGHYFERLIQFWLHHAGAGDLRAGLKAGQPGHTAGEFDFVFRKEEWGGWLHWEIAIKFYLQQVSVADWDHFIGPNPHDRLSNKLHKLFEQQLQLSDTPAGRAALGFNHALTPRALVKGWLFYPASGAAVPVPGLSSHALAGWWLRHGAEPLPTHHPTPRWKLLHRLAWLAPARATASETKTVFDTEQINVIVARHFARSHAPVLLAELAPDETGVWQEIARGFVVSAGWPREPAAP